MTQADAFDFGAGHVVPNNAIWTRASSTTPASSTTWPASAARPKRTSSFADPDATCAQLASVGYSLDASDLNLPSIGIAELPATQTVRRTRHERRRQARARYTAHRQGAAGLPGQGPAADAASSKPGQTAASR